MLHCLPEARYSHAMPRLTLAHSPDADDLVMWWPLAGLQGSAPAIDTQGFEFDLIGADVEELNKLLIAGETPYDLCAISAAAYPHVSDRYRITACGASFGEGYGPKLVCRPDHPSSQAPLEALRNGATLAIPGVNTTAFNVLKLAVGDRHGSIQSQEMPFLEIAPAVLDGRIDFGLLIHEAQLTFAEIGLSAALDLGAWWEQTHDLPLPLGLNVVARNLDERFGTGTTDRVARMLVESVDYALAHPDESQQYLLRTNPNRTEWQDRDLLEKYLSMYVSVLTRDAGARGEQSLRVLYTSLEGLGVLSSAPSIDIAR